VAFSFCTLVFYTLVFSPLASPGYRHAKLPACPACGRSGDAVTVIKDLKPNGGDGVVKQGTRVKNIRLVDGDHDIDCKIDGCGAMSLNSKLVRKS
jgi:uncharacterized Zn ribbon protein